MNRKGYVLHSLRKAMADSHTTWYTFPAKLLQWTWQFHFSDKSLVRSKGSLRLYLFDGPLHYADTFACLTQFSEQREMQHATRFRCKSIWKQMFMLVIGVTSQCYALSCSMAFVFACTKCTTWPHATMLAFCSHICPYISHQKVCVRI